MSNEQATEAPLRVLRPEGLLVFQSQRTKAVNAVTERFYSTHGSIYAQYGIKGRETCSDDLTFHLDFLRPVLEFGLQQPMVDYLVWLGSVLSARAIPTDHVPLSLRWLAEYFVQHMDAVDGAVISEAVRSVLASVEQAVDAPPAALLPYDVWPETAAFKAALLSGRQGEALHVVKHLIDAGHRLVDVERYVMQPALFEIGEAWQANTVSVAQEHMATAIVHSAMTVGLSLSTPAAPIGKRVLLACVAGNLHAVGLHMVSDAFQMAGWDVQYLGANTPTPALVAQVLKWRPHLLGLSVSFAQQLRVVKEIMAQLTQRLGPDRPAVMLGGLAVNRFTQLAALAGADVHCMNAHTAVAYASQTPRLAAPNGLVSG